MKVTVLASGSKGNCTYIETDEAKIIIDCGISFRQIKKRLEINDIELSDIDGLLVSHEHGDHVSGIPTLLGRIPTRVYMSHQAYGKMYPTVKNGIPIELISYIDGPLQIKDMTIIPFKTSHDSADSLGFIFESNGKKIVHVTDTGYLPDEVLGDLKDADTYLFESNYDPDMLLSSTRPHFLKQRIFGIKGHLSNQDSAILLNKLVTERTKAIIFIHLSQECNTPGCAERTHKAELEKFSDIETIYSHQDAPTKIIEV